MMPCILTDFKQIRPHHDMEQEQLLDWIAEAHARAEHRDDGPEREAFRSRIRQELSQLGLGKERIGRRGLQISDPFLEDWTHMEIYPVGTTAEGLGFTGRSHFYDRETSRIFERFYPEGSHLPAHLIHVTCTGYVAPSPAQKIVSLRDAGLYTTVTHAYHMGCYGAIAAIRIASGYARFSPADSSDIVHTELGSLHMHPMRHSKEQLLIQSLFADGFIKYTVTANSPSGKHLNILALHEETVPHSSHCMTWRCEDKGLGMTLSREVPVMIARSIGGYLQRLCNRAGLDRTSVIEDSFFAIHPGGPKIVQQVQELLGLKPHQIAHSMDILRSCGNMSSATLPHIWEKILDDPNVPHQSRIVSMAFGPGLSISGCLLEKGAW